MNYCVQCAEVYYLFDNIVPYTPFIVGLTTVLVQTEMHSQMLMKTKIEWYYFEIYKSYIVIHTLRKVSKEPFSMYSVMIMTGLLLVTTPCRKITLGCSNWPIIDASVKKSLRALSAEPGFRVLMATSISVRPSGGNFSLPRHTSPNSPPPWNHKSKLKEKKLRLNQIQNLNWNVLSSK